MKNVSVTLFSFFSGGNIGDHEGVCQNSSASLVEGALVMKNVSVKLFSFFSGGIIGDQRTCLSKFQLH